MLRLLCYRLQLFQKWFVLSYITGCYTGSAETVMDRDMRNIADKGFIKWHSEKLAACYSKVI